MRDRRLARFKRPWTWAGAHLSVKSPTPTESKPTCGPAQSVSKHISQTQGAKTMNFITTKDATKVAYKDWGKGQPMLFSHGWPLTGDAWEAQMLFFGQNGYRVIAHDRRGHGKSDQPWDGNNMDQYADD